MYSRVHQLSSRYVGPQRVSFHSFVARIVCLAMITFRKHIFANLASIKELSHRTVSDTRPILFGWYVNLIPFENSKISLGNCTCVFTLSAKGEGVVGGGGF